MLELLLILALVTAVFVAAAVPWPSLLLAGVVTTGVGLVFGLVTGFYYHLALGRALWAARALPPRWWLRPVPLHGRLDAAGRRHVMPWFYAGAAGFFVTVVGMSLVGLGIAVGAWRTP